MRIFRTNKKAITLTWPVRFTLTLSQVKKVQVLALTIVLLAAFALLVRLLYPIYEIKKNIDILQTHDVQIKMVASQDSKFATPEYSVPKTTPVTGWLELENTANLAALAVVVSEDWAFFQHRGIDYYQVLKALADSLQSDKKLRGASTLSQQVVKNLFLTNERSWSRKLKEALYTLYLEQKLSKARILEIYLNIVEFGPGIYGLNKASQHYFKKVPKYLNAKEGAFLAMLLPNPKRHYHSFKQKELTPFAEQVIEKILLKLHQIGLLGDVKLEELRLMDFDWEIRQ